MSGSLQNMLAERATQSYADTPSVGDPATIVYWTDRTPATVVEVEDKDHITLQEDKADYAYPEGYAKSVERNPNGRLFKARRVKRGLKKGQWRTGGLVVLIGVRDAFYDHSF